MNKIKHHRTYHLPWSLSITADDKRLSHKDIKDHFARMPDAFASIKMDGECTTIGKGYSHARSLDSKSHWSRNHIKQLADRLYNDIPDGWRIVGENLLATHSIEYDNLDSYFQVFGIWNEHNVRLHLDEMLEFCEILDLTFVPIIKRAPFALINWVDLQNQLDLDKHEGYVISNSESFHYNDSRFNVGKFVRMNHVQTDEHWMFNQEQKRNGLKNETR